MKRILISFAVIAFLSGCGNPGSMQLYQVEPLVKILHSDSSFADKTDTINVARGENAAFQFVLCSQEDVSDLTLEVDNAGLGKTKLGWVHDVTSFTHPSGADDMISAPGDLYPDPIIDDEAETVTKDTHKTIWVDINIPRDAKPGIYTCQLRVKGKGNKGNLSLGKKFRINVYPVTLPEEQSLKVVNMSWNCLEYLNNGEDVPFGSDRYFELLKVYAESVAEFGQNCWTTPAKPEVKLNEDGTDFYLDFENFDKAMDILEKYGNMKYFCNSYLGGRRDEKFWDEQMYFHLTTVVDKQLVDETVPYTDPRLKEYIQKYYSQIEKHFREKGWVGRCMQHIADEPSGPGTDSQISWSAVAAMVKEVAPDIKTIEPSSDIIENQDIGVILLGDNIDSLPPVPDDSERWMYTCTGPQGNYANRFIQLPLLKTRILHWINFKYNEVGYLHWGLSAWTHVNDPLHNATPANYDWPGGDTHIVYPAYNKIYPSIRLNAMRDGIRDYELLRMVEQKDPEKAKEICNSIILGRDNYDMDIDHFYQVRKEMLEFLSDRQ